MFPVSVMSSCPMKHCITVSHHAAISPTQELSCLGLLQHSNGSLHHLLCSFIMFPGNRIYHVYYLLPVGIYKTLRLSLYSFLFTSSSRIHRSFIPKLRSSILLQKNVTWRHSRQTCEESLKYSKSINNHHDNEIKTNNFSYIFIKL